MSGKQAEKALLWFLSILSRRFGAAKPALFEGLNRIGHIKVGDNEPYDGALKGDTMYRHCTKKGIAHILIEVRQDLIGNEKGVTEWTDYLEPLFRKINAAPMIHMKQVFPSRADK